MEVVCIQLDINGKLFRSELRLEFEPNLRDGPLSLFGITITNGVYLVASVCLNPEPRKLYAVFEEHVICMPMDQDYNMTLSYTTRKLNPFYL